MARQLTVETEAQIDDAYRVVSQELGLFVDKVNRSAERALRKAGRVIIETTTPLVPIDTGALRKTGRFVVEKEPAVGGTFLNVSYGDAEGEGEVHYAVFVHEDLTARHKIGQAKYLENGVRLSLPKVLEILKVNLKDVVER